MTKVTKHQKSGRKIRFQFILPLMLVCVFMLKTAVITPAASTRTVKLLPDTKYETALTVIDSGKSGPTVLVVGGVHGSEPAGYRAADQLKEESIAAGRLLILPRANAIGVKKGQRAPSETGNLNRNFPSAKNGSADGALAKAILAMMKEYRPDWVIDLHEGINYAGLSSSDSVGQSVIYYPSGQAAAGAKKIVSALNSSITTSYRQFQLLKYPVKGSLSRAAAVSCGASSMIVETCTRDKLETRITRQLKAVRTILSLAGMQ